MTDPREIVARAIQGYLDDRWDWVGGEVLNLAESLGEPNNPTVNQLVEDLYEMAGDALQALRDEGLVQEWQTMETAPQDGTPILGWAEEEEDGWQIMVVHWVEAQHDPHSKFVEHDAGWAGRILFPGHLSDEENPCPPTFTITHWMPLPPPPAAEREGEDT